jgi:hypothetical protein
VTGFDALRKRLRGETPDSELPAPPGSLRTVRQSGARSHRRREPLDGPTAGLLADARERLEDIAATSSRASEAIRRKTGLDRDELGDGTEHTAAQDLMASLVERIEDMHQEASRLAALLDRTEGGLAPRPSPPDTPEPSGEASSSEQNGADREPSESVPIEKVRALVATMAGAGASRQEIAAWVFREQGVVVSDRILEEAIRTRPGARRGDATP